MAATPLFLILMSCLLCAGADQLTEETHILVAHHSDTNRTGSFAALICNSAAAQPVTSVRCKPVTEVTCDDLKWMHGIALGTPVYWGSMSGVMKSFLDDVQNRCFGWPVAELRWKVGAAFTTGAHLSSGKEPTMQAIHLFYLAVQMVIVGNEPEALCMMGACATNHNESSLQPTFNADEEHDAAMLGQRLVTMAKTMRPLMAPSRLATAVTPVLITSPNAAVVETD